MKRNWQLRELSIHFAQKTASVTLADGALSVHVHFAFDPQGDQKESAVQAQALKRAKELLSEASEADVKPVS